jgi:acetyl-CoA carboxylase carboxyltransferase component
MITAVSEATVPQVSVIARKAYGAGLYAMAGPGFMPDACIALPTAKIAIMGPQAAVNAVYANKIAEITDADEQAEFVATKRAEYEQDVDLMRLASDLVLDAVVEPSELRAELIRRYAVLVGKSRETAAKRHGVPPT